MASIPFGLSVHHFISSVGADAGFAALIGLALLILLYFAHARETATLRSRADEAGLRVQELEFQLADLADQLAALPAEISVRAAGPRAAATAAGVHARAVAGVGAAVDGLTAHGRPLPPAAPAGVGAPALAAATRMIPLPDGFERVEPVPATAAGATNGATRVPVGAGATVQRPVPASAGGGVRGAQVPAGSGRATGAPVRPGGAGRPGAGPPRPPGQGRPGTVRPGGPVPPMRPAPKRSRTGRILAAIAVAAVGAAVVVAAVLLLTKGGSKAPHSSTVSSTLASRRAASKAAAVVRPASVTVSVLNGTDQSGLAARVSAQLVADGYRKGAVTNAANQTQTTSVVAYMTAADRPQAVAVAGSLKLKAGAVQAIDASTRTIACSASPSPCASTVVVTIGQDLAAQ